MRISEGTAFVIQTASGIATMAGGTWYIRDTVSKICFDCCSGPTQQIGLTLLQSVFLASSFFGNGYVLSGSLLRKVVTVEGEATPAVQVAKKRFQ